MTRTSELSNSPILAHAASSPGGVLHALEKIADNSTHPLARELGEMFAAASNAAVSQEKGDPHFQFMYSERPDEFQDEQARLHVVGRHLERQIDELRLQLLATGSTVDCPAPYDHQALVGIELSQDQLVSLSEFDVDGLALTRNGHTFAPVPPINGENAAYWFMQTVARRGLHETVSVRLDPLMHRPSNMFSRVEYKMWLHGRRLDLSQVVTLSQEQFGRWLPGKMSRSVQFTDYVWVPRDGELHLTLEEVPRREEITIRGSRYLHAIYDPARKVVVHLDGAVRIFDQDQWRERSSRHVRHSGKAGVRVKIFRVDREVEVEDMTCLAACYFVWNYDVAKFCGVPVPDQLLA